MIYHVNTPAGLVRAADDAPPTRYLDREAAQREVERQAQRGVEAEIVEASDDN